MSIHKLNKLPFGAPNQENEKSFSGHINVTGGKIFYWLFEYTGLNYEKEESSDAWAVKRRSLQVRFVAQTSVSF